MASATGGSTPCWIRDRIAVASASGRRADPTDPGSAEGYCLPMAIATVPRIGPLRERPLHAALKRWYEQPGDRPEHALDGYVIDLVRDDLLIEIQTRNVSSMRRKLETLLGHGHRVRLVLPLLTEVTIVRVDDDGVLLGRRRSPRHQRPCDAFAELVSIAQLLHHPDLELDLVSVEIDEVRRHVLDGPWRRRGWRVLERRLVTVGDVLPIRGLADLAALLPGDLVEPFTSAELATSLGSSRRVGQQMTYCLRLNGAIEALGRRGNAV